MNANPTGTASEKARANMGWQSPTARKKADITDNKKCRNCHFFYIKETAPRDGSCCGNYISYCGHPWAGGKYGHATRDNASCAKWEMKQ